VPDAEIILISDLHLQDSRPDITRAFVDFTAALPARCTDLFILGDLFELWIGDDSPSRLAELVANALRTVARRGIGVHLMHGNRDFLLGEQYAQRCGAGLIEEPHRLHVQGGDWLLLHGDVLCTDDVDYQKFRAMVRNPAWQRDFLSRPLAERQAWADRARQQSKAATSGKPSEIMDVNPEAVNSLIESSGCPRIVHGHTHRPAVHELAEAGPDAQTPARRIVLGDWDRQGWYAAIQGAEIKLQQFSFRSEPH